MSVNENDRRNGKLKVLNMARELTLYTLGIAKNEDVFTPYDIKKNPDGSIEKVPNETKADLIRDINRYAKHVYLYGWLANDIRVGKWRDWERRDDYQNVAIDSCNALLVSMGLAKTTFHLKSKRMVFWGRSTVNVRNALRAWHESDTKRYEDMLSKLERHSCREVETLATVDAE